MDQPSSCKPQMDLASANSLSGLLLQCNPACWTEKLRTCLDRQIHFPYKEVLTFMVHLCLWWLRPSSLSSVHIYPCKSSKFMASAFSWLVYLGFCPAGPNTSVLGQVFLALPNRAFGKIEHHTVGKSLFSLYQPTGLMKNT